MAKKPQEDAIDHFHAYGLHIPTRTIYLDNGPDGEGISDFVAERAIKNLHILESISKDPITIILNTTGGDVYSGLAIYDAIISCQSAVCIKAMGTCMSVGTIILQAGDIRSSTKNTRFMVHLGSEGYGQDHIINVRRWVKENISMDNILLSIYLDKIKQKNPRYSRTKLKTLLTFDKIMSAKEMIDLGLLDETEEQHGG